MFHDVKAAQCPRFPLHDAQRPAYFDERIQLSQHQSMGNPEKPGKRTTVNGNTLFGSNDERRLQRCQPQILRLTLRDKGEKPLGLIAILVVHAASRLRNDTMIDLEVGVSLSSPALPKGTSTFSSG
ncbi:hypothetical protein D3C80_1507560 [compost metagenome]